MALSNCAKTMEKVQRVGAVVGCLVKNGSNKEGSKDAERRLTVHAQALDKESDGCLTRMLDKSKPLKSNDLRVFYDVTEKYNAVAVVGIGEDTQEKSHLEDRDLARHNLRNATAVGLKALRGVGMTRIYVDTVSHPDAAAEAAELSAFKLPEEFRKKPKEPEPVATHEPLTSEDASLIKQWTEGLVLARAQNFARYLAEVPCSHMYPEKVCEAVNKRFHGNDKVNCQTHDRQWAEEKGMGSFLSVNAGSCHEPRFLELTYQNGAEDQAPVILVGKGVCFDSGGISIKGSAKMDHMRMDMGGGATVLGVLDGIVNLPDPPKLNLKVLVPLVENMPDSRATKPGDIVKAMDGTQIKVDNTDAEGRLILADALCYANSFKPSLIVDVATLTGAMGVALGTAASGCFTQSDDLWKSLREACYQSGDRLWRLPLYDSYVDRMKDRMADLCNIPPKGGGGGASLGAAFLKNFVQCDRWVHLDIANTMFPDEGDKYLDQSYTGKPTRSLIEFLRRL